MYHGYYQPDYKLNRNLNNTIVNLNTAKDNERIRETCMEYLRHLACAPGQPHPSNALPVWKQVRTERLVRDCKPRQTLK